MWDCRRRSGRAERETGREASLERKVLAPREVEMLHSKRSLCLGDAQECAFRVRDGFHSGVQQGSCAWRNEVHVRTGQRACERSVVDVKVQVGFHSPSVERRMSACLTLFQGWDFSRSVGVTVAHIWVALQLLMEDLDLKVTEVAHSGSSACRGICIRHMEVALLWLQQCVQPGKLSCDGLLVQGIRQTLSQSI